MKHKALLKIFEKRLRSVCAKTEMLSHVVSYNPDDPDYEKKMDAEIAKIRERDIELGLSEDAIVICMPTKLTIDEIHKRWGSADPSK